MSQDGGIQSDDSPECYCYANPNAFGHAGWGGSVAVADMDAQVSWTYVMNKMEVGTTGDIRAQRLSKALYDSLE